MSVKYLDLRAGQWHLWFGEGRRRLKQVYEAKRELIDQGFKGLFIETEDPEKKEIIDKIREFSTGMSATTFVAKQLDMYYMKKI